MIRTLSELGRRVAYLARNRREILRLSQLDCNSHPLDRRKTERQRYIDFLYMTLRWGEPSALYYAQQVDLNGRNVRKDFLPYQHFRRIRDSHNRNGVEGRTFNYVCLLQDKLVFERYFSSTGVPTAPVLGVVKDGLFSTVPVNSSASRDFWVWGQEKCAHQVLFCKPQDGIKGDGVFKLEFAEGRAFLNDVAVTRQELLKKFGRSYLVQRLIPQHPQIARFHPASLNTLRMITFSADGEIELFLTYLRMGAGGRVNDNNNESRAAVRVDHETGRLYDTGFAIHGDEPVLAAEHPTTGCRFLGQEIPYFGRCRELAISAHRQLPGLLSVGWDIAITPDGPLLLEGNDDWGATIAMWLMPNFREQFMARTWKR